MHLQATLPDGTTDVRFRYSTDAAYLDTGLVRRRRPHRRYPGDASSEEWIQTTGEQDNNWLVQLICPCDLTPGVDLVRRDRRRRDVYLYRFEGDLIEQGGFSTSCLRGSTTTLSLTVAISNLPTGDLTVLDADYVFRVNNTAVGPTKK